MKWWYETLEYGKSEEYDNLDDLSWGLSWDWNYRNHVENHDVPNYYIYCDQYGLFSIVKGSDLDPLSITRVGPQKRDLRNIFYDVKKIEKKFDVRNDAQVEAIVLGNFRRSKKQREEIKIALDKINGEEDLDMSFMGLVYVKEYKIKDGIGNVPVIYVNETHKIEDKCYEENVELIHSANAIPNILDNLYYLDKIDDAMFVFAYQKDELLGYYLTSQDSVDDIYRFLLLVGADEFVITHVTKNGRLQVDEDYYELIKKVMKTNNLFKIDLKEFIIMNFAKYRLVKDEAIDIVKTVRKKENLWSYYRDIEDRYEETFCDI